MNWLNLIKALWRLLPLSDNLRWRVMSLLLEPILPLIAGSVVYANYQQEKEWRNRRIRPFQGDPFPQLPQKNIADIYFWSVIDWHFRIQRPQHLAKGFADRGHRVFYISNVFINAEKPGFELEQIDGVECLYNVRLYLKGCPRIYASPPTPDDAHRLQASVAALLEWIGDPGSISIVQHPYWCDQTYRLPDSRLIYDCLDHQEGFSNTGKSIAELEQLLLTSAEAVVVTSGWLRDVAARHNSNVAVIRNAVEYEIFSQRPVSVFCDAHKRTVIGYYGAIAEWIDVELLKKIAERHSDCLLLLVGADEIGAQKFLEGPPNVVFTGEVKYAELPFYLYGMDLCILPFRVMPLTLATNPVKVYEYLSAGKPVISVNLPEMAQFGELVKVANGHEEFLDMIGKSLAIGDEETAVKARRDFASKNTWHNRIDAYKNVIDKLPEPRISVVIVTYNNLELTRACLESLEQFNNYSNVETIVVDNSSSDGSQDYLKHWEAAASNRQVILNTENRGFAAANNQGLLLASGEFLVLLNNDTEVTPSWLRTLMGHLTRDRSIGMVGPVTNNIGNEAQIPLQRGDKEHVRKQARRYTLRHMGEAFPMRTLAFFCVMLSRRVFDAVGPLDEAYGLGFFEDDDYCRRVEQAGWRLACAEDVFVYHHLSASFNQLGEQRQKLLEKNRRIYENKWGPWIPHRHRKKFR